MANFRVPRQLMEFFRHDKEIQRFFDSLQGILTGSNSNLADLAQRSPGATLSRIDQIEKELDYLKKEIRHGAVGRMSELEREIRQKDDEKRGGLKGQIEELKRRITDIEDSKDTR